MINYIILCRSDDDQIFSNCFYFTTLEKLLFHKYAFKNYKNFGMFREIDILQRWCFVIGVFYEIIKRIWQCVPQCLWPTTLTTFSKFCTKQRDPTGHFTSESSCKEVSGIIRFCFIIYYRFIYFLYSERCKSRDSCLVCCFPQKCHISW
jgi:hypothetical protein